MPAWALEFYADERGREPCREWMERDPSDVQHDALVEALRLVLYEFRVRHTAKEIAAMFGRTPPGGKAGERVLLRVFFHAYGKRVVLLLGGYDKGKDPSERRQQGEIATARKRLDGFKARQAAERRGRRKR